LRPRLSVPTDWRPASTLIVCRTPTRPQCNPRLAPQTTCLWQRRQLNPRFAPVIASFGKAGDQFPDFGWLPHLRLSPVACLPLLPFPESFRKALVGLPACAGPQFPHSAFVRPRISSIAGSLGLRFELRGFWPLNPSHRLVVNFRLQPDLASSAEPPMSIPHPPSIAPPDHLRLTFRLSPSVSSSGSASFATFQLALRRRSLARRFDQCAGFRLRLNLHRLA